MATTAQAPPGFQRITEGSATILFPEGAVFYNPVQEFNRDMSANAVAVFAERYLAEQLIPAGRLMRRRADRYTELLQQQREKQQKDGGAGSAAATAAAAVNAAVTSAAATAAEADSVLSQSTANAASAAEPHTHHNRRSASDPLFRREEHGIRALEALGASGLRSIRYYNEIPTVKQVICNDLSADAVEAIRRNVAFNGLNDSNQVVPHQGDANMYMYQHKSYIAGSDHTIEPLHVVDLDPYGSAAPFIDAAVQAVADGGLLCVTCTDMAVLAGNRTEACFSRYGGMSIRAAFNHEMGVRVLLGLIATTAARYGRHMQPLLSCAIDFYCRVFVRIFVGAEEARLLSSQTCYVLQCTGCQYHHVFYAGRHEPPAEVSRKQRRRQQQKAKRRADQEQRRKHLAGKNGAGNEVEKEKEEEEQQEEGEEEDEAKMEVEGEEAATASSSSATAPATQATGPKQRGGKFKAGSGPKCGSNCPHCGRTFVMGGPMWGAAMHDRDFVEACLERLQAQPEGAFGTAARMQGMLQLCLEELPDQPFHWTIDGIAGTLHCGTPTTEDIFSALGNAGYKASGSHCHAQGFKTDAPPEFIYDMYRQKVKEHPVHEKVMKTDSPASAILSKPMTHAVDFTYNKEAQPPSRLQGVLRYQVNMPEWGPKSRAKPQQPQNRASPVAEGPDSKKPKSG